MAAKRNTADGYDLLVSELQKDPTAAYATLRDKAEAKGFTVYPVMFGRAKASLGLVSTKPRKRNVAKRGPGRPKGSRNKNSRVQSGGIDVGGLADMVRNLQRERDEAVAKLERIRALLL